jgi:hypothetical protein
MQLKIILFVTERIIGKDETESQSKVCLRQKKFLELSLLTIIVFIFS